MIIPQEAIDAACDALAETGSAVAALEAAAPHIAAAERERIRQLAIDCNAQYVPGCPDHACPGATAHMADEVAPFAALLTEGTTP